MDLIFHLVKGFTVNCFFVGEYTDEFEWGLALVWTLSPRGFMVYNFIAL